jgi:hypothetical protein
VSLRQCHIYVQALQLYTEFLALPPNAVPIKCHDFEGPVNCSGHFAS